MYEIKETCILLPTLNEAETILDVISDFRNEGFENFLIVDGGSTDGTQELLEDSDVTWFVQNGDGKGQAVREARERITAEYIIMADADATYKASDAVKLLRPLVDGEAEHVIGNRFADMKEGSMSATNQFGNRVINFAFRCVHRTDMQDILSGYRGFTKEGFNRLHLDSDGFGIETEIAVDSIRTELETTIVPIEYHPRPDGSDTNLSPLTHGPMIFTTLYKLARTNNPLFYFGSMGGVLSSVGTGLATYVAYDWFVNGATHLFLTMGVVFMFLLGIQFLILGVLTDTMQTYHKKTLYEVRRQGDNVSSNQKYK